MYGTHIYHKKSTIHVGKYTSPMDPMGKIANITIGDKASLHRLQP